MPERVRSSWRARIGPMLGHPGTEHASCARLSIGLSVVHILDLVRRKHVASLLNTSSAVSGNRLVEHGIAEGTACEQ